MQPVDPDELKIANSGPALFANRFFVTVGPVVRVVFAEQAGPDATPFFRSAVALTHQDAIALADLMKALLVDVEKEIAAAVKQAQGRNEQS